MNIYLQKKLIATPDLDTELRSIYQKIKNQTQELVGFQETLKPFNDKEQDRSKSAESKCALLREEIRKEESDCATLSQTLAERSCKNAISDDWWKAETDEDIIAIAQKITIIWDTFYEPARGRFACDGENVARLIALVQRASGPEAMSEIVQALQRVNIYSERAVDSCCNNPDLIIRYAEPKTFALKPLYIAQLLHSIARIGHIKPEVIKFFEKPEIAQVLVNMGNQVNCTIAISVLVESIQLLITHSEIKATLNACGLQKMLEALKVKVDAEKSQTLSVYRSEALTIISSLLEEIAAPQSLSGGETEKRSLS